MEEENSSIQNEGLIRRTFNNVRAWGDNITGRKLLTITYIIIAIVILAGVLTVISMFK